MSSVPASLDRQSSRPTVLAPRWVEVVSNLDPRFGGITAAVPELSGALRRAGIDVSAAAFCGTDEVEGGAWPIVPERFPSGRLHWFFNRDLRSRFRQSIRSAAGLHIHGLWQTHCSVAAGMARANRIPYLISAHGMLERWAMGNKAWKKRIYSALVESRNLAAATCLHALTEGEAEDYRRAGLRNPVAVIPNGIHMPPPASPSLFLQRFPMLAGKRVVLFLSRIHYKKGLDILIEAWHRVQSEVPDAHLVLAGPDFEETRASIEQRTKELGIGQRVTFTGMLQGDMKWSALRAAELYVLPSYSEGFSVAILEAMAMGKPVVITRQCNFPEVAAKNCGWQIEPRKQDLEEALMEALTLPPERLRERGSRGLDLVSSQFTWAHVGEQMASTYRWISGGPKPDVLRVID